jgi:hypothetical protein
MNIIEILLDLQSLEQKEANMEAQKSIVIQTEELEQVFLNSSESLLTYSI